MLMADKEPYLKENPHMKPLIPTQMNVGEVGIGGINNLQASQVE
jgi:hypothetical protein